MIYIIVGNLFWTKFHKYIIQNGFRSNGVLDYPYYAGGGVVELDTIKLVDENIEKVNKVIIFNPTVGFSFKLIQSFLKNKNRRLPVEIYFIEKKYFCELSSNIIRKIFLERESHENIVIRFLDISKEYLRIFSSIKDNTANFIFFRHFGLRRVKELVSCAKKMKNYSNLSVLTFNPDVFNIVRRYHNNVYLLFPYIELKKLNCTSFLSNDPIKIIFPSRLSYEKRIDILFRICLEFPKRKFLIYISVPEDITLSDLGIPSSIGNVTVLKVPWVNHWKDLEKLYKNKHITFFYGSFTEGFGLTPFESIQHGVLPLCFGKAPVNRYLAFLEYPFVSLCRENYRETFHKIIESLNDMKQYLFILRKIRRRISKFSSKKQYLSVLREVYVR